MTLTNPQVDRRVRSGSDFLAFNRPGVVGRELHYVASAITESNISGGGMYTEACQRVLEDYMDVGTALLVTSCTSALEMAAVLCDLGPGDQVIMPSYTFVSTAQSVVRVGATPVFVDIRPDTLNLDESLIEASITPRTKAIWPIHYAGVGAEMDAIMEIAADHDLMVVEDAAQGIGASYKGRPLGSIAPISTYSFHETKNVICGEGGALCLNDPVLVERAEVIRDKGTNRRQFQLGNADKYTWTDQGSSYVLSEMLAAFLLGQFEELNVIANHRASLWERYQELLAPLTVNGQARLPQIPAYVEQNHHIYYIVTADREQRDALIGWLGARDIQAVFHYVPLHSSPVGSEVGRHAGPLPVTDMAGSCLVRLPLHHELELADVERVADAVYAFYQSPLART